MRPFAIVDVHFAVPVCVLIRPVRVILIRPVRTTVAVEVPALQPPQGHPFLLPIIPEIWSVRGIARGGVSLGIEIDRAVADGRRRAARVEEPNLAVLDKKASIGKILGELLALLGRWGLAVNNAQEPFFLSWFVLLVPLEDN
jgi:hypothetical protein